jgi:hypothetical protein
MVPSNMRPIAICLLSFTGTITADRKTLPQISKVEAMLGNIRQPLGFVPENQRGFCIYTKRLEASGLRVCFETSLSGPLMRFSALPVLTNIEFAPLRFLKNHTS